MPSLVIGGFVITIPAEIVALLVIGQSLQLDLAQLREGQGRIASAGRLVIGLILGQMDLRLILVSPLFSLGIRPR